MVLERGKEGIELGEGFAVSGFELFDRFDAIGKFLLKLKRRPKNAHVLNFIRINICHADYAFAHSA